MRCQIGRLRYLDRACLLDVGDVGVGPDDLGSVATIQLLDAFAWIAGDPTKRINSMGQYPR
jgi:hypothetical protein